MSFIISLNDHLVFIYKKPSVTATS